MGRLAAVYDGIGLITFSPDGKRAAYQAKKGSAQLLVADDREGPEFEEVGNPVFSADGKHLAYRVKKTGKWSVLVDGAPGAEFAADFGNRTEF